MNRPDAATLASHKAAGLTNQQIANIYRVTKPTIAAWLEAASVRAVQHQVPTPSRAELQALYDTPLTQCEVAAHYGVSRATVRRWMSAHGIQARLGKQSHKDKSGLSEEELRRLYEEEQLTDAQIGDRHGIGKEAVWARRRQHGIRSRGRGTCDRKKEGMRGEAVPAEHIPDPTPFPTPGKRKQPKRRKRAFLRLSEIERWIVQRKVDSFLMWLKMF